MTPINFYKDGFFRHHPPYFFYNDVKRLTGTCPKNSRSLIDSFEKDPFNNLCLQQINHIRASKKQITDDFSKAKNNNKNKKLIQKLLFEFKTLEEKQKLLSMFIEHLEKSSQVITQNIK
ncbi:MAG: hypothetical protein KC505_07260 [Myxococcales bacterium]|nr:hypothetical protein [Myxococcales bacterium]USN51546.1 MAG: hypothetical protein H6731_03825 [Myxococcales bacterium]